MSKSIEKWVPILIDENGGQGYFEIQSIKLTKSLRGGGVN